MKRIFALSLVFVILGSILVIPAGAVAADRNTPGSTSTPAEDSPEIISALKSHILVMGESQEARMNGVIRYIDCISRGSATEELIWIQEDYLTAVTSIPLMQTSADITLTRQDMQANSVRFSDETANRLAQLDGNPGTMKDYINDSLQRLEALHENKSARNWLKSEDARLTIFDRSAGNCNLTLSDLAMKGIDVARAKMISETINAERPVLSEIIGKKNDISIRAENGRLKILNQQFRSAIRECRAKLAIKNQIAVTNSFQG